MPLSFNATERQKRMSEYYIPNHVHFAIEGDAAVFVNLRTDQYSMLFGEKARAFSALVSRTGDSIQRVVRIEHSVQDDKSKALQDDLVSDLLAHGVLSRESSNATGHIPAIIPLPQENLLEPQTHRHINIGARDVWTFLVSCVIAKWWLSRARIERAVSAIRRRQHLRGGDNQLDVAEARRLVCIYNKLRPIVPHDYVCLFDSLSLLEFLARYDCYPRWVFAVQLEPWAAHCWLQYGRIAFNEDVDWARTHLPLMSI
jgi:hypothetical protein